MVKRAFKGVCLRSKRLSAKHVNTACEGRQSVNSNNIFTIHFI